MFKKTIKCAIIAVIVLHGIILLFGDIYKIGDVLLSKRKSPLQKYDSTLSTRPAAD